MDFVAHLLQLVSVASLGLFTGAMLTEALVLVPYWRSLPADRFFTWYAANDKRLLGFFGPLTVATALLAVAAASAALWTGAPGRWHALLAAALTITVVSTFFLYFQTANESFASAAIPADRVSAELDRWAAWHWIRTALSALAFAAALLSTQG